MSRQQSETRGPTPRDAYCRHPRCLSKMQETGTPGAPAEFCPIHLEYCARCDARVDADWRRTDEWEASHYCAACLWSEAS